jgi:nucleoside-diphosphate-sugar epimerase
MVGKVFITGGAGYCGSVLVPNLLNAGYEVTVLDTFWFGNSLGNSPQLKLITGDIRDQELLKKAIPGHDMLLHLACIANDASFELDEKLSTSVNYEAFEPLVKIAKQSGVQRFVYASSSSVYGVSSATEVTEDHPLVPLTLYNKYKGMCEPILLNYVDSDFIGVIFRPATVCGYSPRQRLDLTVNILTNYAFHKGEILVFGGNQKRPNLHVKDYARVCQMLLSAKKDLVNGEIFNVGNENLTINEIAELVKTSIEFRIPSKGDIKITQSESSDLRSYHINSDKIMKNLGYAPNFNVKDAVNDLIDAFENQLLEDTFNLDEYYNLRTMKRLRVT